ncbi:hypothetical protein OSB04_007069 [Centaurea solstitialis]|uniref:DUF7792 domain-containing protein n=1 Tax=Centaurea solstitialis TaxID=347529 RepID=A0AA38TKY8_9ASTR|nr:hypothetical protein OSB04_007069 [Centaurea solstitialis]
MRGRDRVTGVVPAIVADIAKQILAKPIQLADQVIRFAQEASINKQECVELKSKTEKLAGLLRQAVRASNDLHERPTRRIVDEIEQVLDKALSLALKCRNEGFVNRVFTIIPAAAFRKMSSQLDNSIGDVSWLLRISAPISSTDEYLGLPPIVANEPILCLIWEQIAILYSGTLDDRSDAAASLVSLARESDRYRKLIIKEGGIYPLLKLVKEGNPEGQENAASAIGLLGRDPETVEHMIRTGVCWVFVNTLKEGPMKVQAVVAWAVSELVLHYPKCQDVFAQHNIVRLLIGHLAFETVEEHNTNSNGRELEDTATKAYMKSMAAKALSHLAKGNSTICRSITESRGLFCFVVLLEKGPEEVRYNSAMALMEMTGVAEKDYDLRIAAFKPDTPAREAVIEQLLQIIEKADSRLLLIPCIKAIGNLARTFSARECRMIQLLVQLLDDREAEITKEAALALIKFACTENYQRLNNSKVIISARGAKHLVQLVYFGEQMVQSPALMLLCYIAQHVPDSEDLAQAEVLTALDSASKQASLIQNEKNETRRRSLRIEQQESAENQPKTSNPSLMNEAVCVTDIVQRRKRGHPEAARIDTEVTTKKRKHKHKDKGIENKPKKILVTITVRTTPNPLFNAIRTMSEAQQECIRDMGFGGLIGMKLDGIPPPLGLHVALNFDQYTLTIKTSKAVIEVNEESIKDIP